MRDHALAAAARRAGNRRAREKRRDRAADHRGAAAHPYGSHAAGLGLRAARPAGRSEGSARLPVPADDRRDPLARFRALRALWSVLRDRRRPGIRLQPLALAEKKLRVSKIDLESACPFERKLRLSAKSKRTGL